MQTFRRIAALMLTLVVSECSVAFAAEPFLVTVAPRFVVTVIEPTPVDPLRSIVDAALADPVLRAKLQAEIERTLNRTPPHVAATSPADHTGVSGVTPASRSVGLHSHRCSACGSVWSHGAASHGDRESHSCPKCGRVEWSVHVVAKPIVMLAPSQPGCVNGQCPLPIRRSRR